MQVQEVIGLALRILQFSLTRLFEGSGVGGFGPFEESGLGVASDPFRNGVLGRMRLFGWWSWRSGPSRGGGLGILGLFMGGGLGGVGSFGGGHSLGGRGPFKWDALGGLEWFGGGLGGGGPFGGDILKRTKTFSNE